VNHSSQRELETQCDSLAHPEGISQNAQCHLVTYPHQLQVSNCYTIHISACTVTELTSCICSELCVILHGAYPVKPMQDTDLL